MKIATGKIVGGKVVLEGEPLAEGLVVTVVAREDDETFDVSPDEEQALFSAIAQAERGEDRKSTRLNSSHIQKSRMPSSA